MSGRPQPILVGGAVSPLGARLISRAVSRVLSGERRHAAITVTVLGKRRMQRLNREFLRHDRVTDVIAFPLELPRGGLAGDIYLCRFAAARQARRLGVSLPEELTRLAVHGTLHVLGYDHPDGAGRERSRMWRRQERYVRDLA